jgi:hypothetical protein
MDSNVIQFPTHAVREWIEYERSMQTILERNGASPEMIKEVIARMNEVFKKFAARFDFHFEMPPLPEDLRVIIQDSINKALKKFGDQVHEYTNELIHDRLWLEVELYNLRHEGPEEA